MAKVMKSEMKISEASELLGLSYRQTFRIAKRYGKEGAGGAGASESRSDIESGVG